MHKQLLNSEVSLSALESWYAEREDQIREDFLTFLRFKSIGTDSAYNNEVRKTAEWTAAYLKASGMNAEIWETSGHPVVFGTHLEAGPNCPTILLYAHYDVQPVDPLDLWQTPPFEPSIREGIVYARGACDDKGQCFYAMQAIRAFLEICRKSKVNIKFFIEGEEESGSKGTKEILSLRKNELKSDYLVVVDMGIPDPATPAVTLGSRGIVTMEMSCTNAATDLHSGAHGGIALNANRILTTLLAQLWDSAGRVAVPHFYDDVVSLSIEEKKKFFLEFDLKEYQSTFGVGAFGSEPGFSPPESNALRPTIEINGMWGGYTGAGFKTVIPAKAFAKLSARLVPNQDPKKIARTIAEFLQKKCPQGAQLDIKFGDAAEAFRGDPNSTIVKIAKKSYEEIFKKPCQLTLSGGSIPIAPSLLAASGGEGAMIGVGLDSDNIHAPNEHFGLDRLKLGFLIVGRILDGLAKS